MSCKAGRVVTQRQRVQYAFRISRAAENFKDLPISERIQLVEDIWDSIAAETPGVLQLAPEERAELYRRYAAHKADPSSSVPWEQVRAALFSGKR